MPCKVWPSNSQATVGLSSISPRGKRPIGKGCRVAVPLQRRFGPKRPHQRRQGAGLAAHRHADDQCG